MIDEHLGAVLFDMDGTLVDSEKVWDIGLRELAARHGGVLSDAARLAIVGTNTRQTMTILYEDIGQPELDPVAGSIWLETRVLELFTDGLDWMPGARELLADVRAAGLRTALVSNTPRVLVNAALLTIGAHHFDAVICGDEVPRTKPDPAPYRLAAAAVGLDPSRCVVIEDSPTGIASAVGAGCAVVGVPNHVPLVGSPATLVESLLDVDLAVLRRAVTGTA
jgi:HAD superfamily hydrolase (TIGR01509 family)